MERGSIMSDLRWKRWKKWLAAVAAGGVVALLVAYLGVSWWIGASVRTLAAEAKAQYAGDSVAALMALTVDEDRSWRDRNHAIWALGQLGDARALPVLRGLQTGEACDHANRVCERELAKAIKAAEGGFNITAWVWRGSGETDGGGR
jgi:HEAT repeat protein